MKKWMLQLGVIFTVGLLLIGCGTDEDSAENNVSTNQTAEQTEGNDAAEQNEDTVLITISIDEGSQYVDEKEIPVEEGDILMDVMKENFYVEEEEGFITSIERVSAEEGEEKGWIFYVNGEMAMVGAEDYELSPGEEINFDFQPWE
ncbi:DUF4430 domain-containing protein [Virgibacillus sp. YIM 98842]|uniref:DUF4430 domain-containing protein n=1 Tax=Virgibacillus sp. YIM 98842 TaxID=2663533 RepID=UPI0013D97C99|nr:DUF4430 domain-containing protein [Virgibacillus sp. YIM 98842]